ncbi:MAG: SOS response-associated peptidase [Cyclobacteriaceae bacterium]|nr:SOS response-associated peptidase [Cyclobacteriaceae bacterium]
MPERYTLTSSVESLKEKFKFELPEIYSPRYNASPAQLLPVVTSVATGGFSYFYWGIIPGWSGNKTISNRLLHIDAEEIISKPGVRKLLRTQRCIIPADGFYIWKKVSKKSQIPYRVVLKDNSMFSMAGLWEEFEDENDQTHHTFRIIQVSSPTVLDGIEEFSPVILDAEGEKTWIDLSSDDESLLKLLAPISNAKLEYYTVSPKISDPINDYPDLVKKVESMDQHGNYSLFD